MQSKFLEISKAILSGRVAREGSNIVGTGDYMFSLAPDGSPARKYSAKTFPESEITSTVNATPAEIFASVVGTYALAHGMTIFLTVNGLAWVVTLSAVDFDDITNATASEIGLVLTNEGIGVEGYQLADRLHIKTDSIGTSATLQITGGTANAVLLIPTTEVIGGNEFHVDANAYQELHGWSIGDYSEISQDIDLTGMDSITGSFRGQCYEDFLGERWIFSILIDGEVRAHRVIDSRNLVFTDVKAPVPDITSTVTVTFRLQLAPGSVYDHLLTPSFKVDLALGTRGYSGTTIYVENHFGGVPTLMYWWILLFGHNATVTWWDTQGNSGDLGSVIVDPVNLVLTWTGSTPLWTTVSSESVYLTLRPYTECTTDEKQGLFIASDGQCLELNGTDAYISIADSDGLDIGDDSTLFAIIKPLDVVNGHIFYRETGGIIGYTLRTGDGDLSLYYEGSGETVDSGLELELDWNYVALIIDGVNLTFILVNSSGIQVSNKLKTINIPNQTAPLYVGSNGSAYIKARFEKVGVYNAQISSVLGASIAQGRIPSLSDLSMLFYLTKGEGSNIRDFSLSRNHGIIQGSGYSWVADAPETYGHGDGSPEAWT